MVYESCRILGSYINRQQSNREYVVIVFPITNKRKTVALSRLIIELILDRELTRQEEVDHKDGNACNNDATNLQILSRAEHNRKTHNRYGNFVDVDYVCDVCRKSFHRTAKQELRANYKLNYKLSHGLNMLNGVFCSSSCATTFQTKIGTLL